MADERNPLADMRGFRWRAESLLRKLQVQRDASQQRFAAAQREARGRLEAAAAQDSSRQQELAWAAARATGTLDTAALSRALAHVTRLAVQAAGARIEAQACKQRADGARATWLALEKQLACVRSVRSAAESQYAADQRRLAAKEADQQWLAQRRGK